jgi:hypothetical protein
MSMSQKAIVEELFGKVTEAMQDAEEMGGPEGEWYQRLMVKIAEEALKRADAHRAHAFDPAPLDQCAAQSSLLKECAGIQWLAKNALEKGAIDEALLHLGMLGTYLERAANLPFNGKALGDD